LTITACYYDSETSGYDADGGTGWTTGGTATSTADMITEATFTGAGWDFTTTWSISSSINSGYPYLTGMEP
jgi:hypothetical protein